MQEVDNYEDFWKPTMEKLGYTGIYSQRPKKADGCAIFWKKHLYALFFHLSFADR